MNPALTTLEKTRMPRVCPPGPAVDAVRSGSPAHEQMQGREELIRALPQPYERLVEGTQPDDPEARELQVRMVYTDSA